MSPTRARSKPRVVVGRASRLELHGEPGPATLVVRRTSTRHYAGWGSPFNRSSMARWPGTVGVVHAPTVGEFQAWFRTDADCLDYLEWVRWPWGFVCPECGHG